MIVDINFIIGNAKEFSEKEISDFKAIVLNAGEVRLESFDSLFAKNPKLMFIPDTNQIDAVGALKIPNNRHKTKIFALSETSEKLENYDFELGWIVSRVEGKGYAKKLVEILIKNPNNIYATVRTENIRMKHILEKYSFKLSGKTYQSVNGDYFIDLYILKIE